MKHKNIFVACDSSNLSEIKKIIKQTHTNKLKVMPKFGLQFFYSKNGRKFLENFKKDFWLDLKINDIPQTALSAIDSLKDLKRSHQLRRLDSEERPTIGRRILCLRKQAHIITLNMLTIWLR